jgi:tetratricopeptide (TPR) repeat protein
VALADGTPFASTIAFPLVVDEDHASMIGPRSRLRFAMLITVVLAAAFVDGGGRLAAAAAAGAEDQDLRARKLFAAGDYRQALEIYVNLYAETLHPTYLRNIGRCQQNLGEADKAIGSFREYLRKAKDLSPAQRQEIEGHIAEMEELKRKQAGGGGAGAGSSSTSPSPSTSAAAGAASPAPVALAAPPPATSGPAPAALLSSPAPAPADDGGSPFYTRAWFWVVVGAVAAGTVATVFLLSRDTSQGPLDTLDLRGSQTP